MKKLITTLFVLLSISVFSDTIKNVGGVVSKASGTYTHLFHWSASDLGKNVTNPPVVNHYGVTKVLEMTVNTDKVSYKVSIPDEYVSGDLVLHIHWTRSGTGTDESAKTVKWQISYLVINGTSENCNSGEASESVQDVYDSAVTDEQIVYVSGDITISSGGFVAHDLVLIEIMAVTVDSGVALANPALVSVGGTLTMYRVGS